MTNHYIETTEIRLGRNFVRKGDPIKVKFDGHDAVLVKFLGAEVDAEGHVVHVKYYGPRPGYSPMPSERYCTPDVVKRVARTRHGEQRELPR